MTEPRKTKKNQGSYQTAGKTGVTKDARSTRTNLPTEKKGWMRPKTMRKVRRWGFYSAAGIIAVLIILSFGLQSFAPTSPTADTGETSPVKGVGSQMELMTSVNHITDPEIRVQYSTDPPTSGDHWFVPAACGIYKHEIPDERVVHNMEHGHVIISYNLPVSDQADHLISVAESLENLDDWGIVRPYAKIAAGSVAMTAWGIMDVSIGVDEDRITKFYNSYARNRFSEETLSFGAIPCSSSIDH